MSDNQPRRILIICKGPVGTSMSSPGIRALNMARVLSRALPAARVTLAAPGASDLVPDAPFDRAGARPPPAELA